MSAGFALRLEHLSASSASAEIMAYQLIANLRVDQSPSEPEMAYQLIANLRADPPYQFPC